MSAISNFLNYLLIPAIIAGILGLIALWLLPKPQPAQPVQLHQLNRLTPLQRLNRRNRLRRLKRLRKIMSQFKLMNRSFVIAAIISFAVGLLIGQAIFSRIPGADLLLAKLAIGFAVSGAWLTWVYHNTPTANKTAVFFFGTLRFRMGPGGKGLTEGLNALPLGWPFFTAEDKYAEEKVIRFTQEKAYAKNKVPVLLDGTFNPYIDDIYKTYNLKKRTRAGTGEESIDEFGGKVITNEFDGEVRDAITSLVLKHIRVEVEAFTPEELVGTEIKEERKKDSIKKVLAKNAYDQIEHELSTRADWGWKIKTTLQINHVLPDAPYEISMENIEKAKRDIQSSNLLLKGRLKQVELAKEHMDPNLAAAFAQVEAGKPGATMNTLNVPGVNALAKIFGEAFAAWLAKQIGGTP